jgi:hypothetical protein
MTSAALASLLRVVNGPARLFAPHTNDVGEAAAYLDRVVHYKLGAPG